MGLFVIRVNCVHPGAVRNPRLTEEALESHGLVRAQTGLPNPLGRLAEPDEQANAVLFLASDEASHVNGVTLDVNGGAYIG